MSKRYLLVLALFVFLLSFTYSSLLAQEKMVRLEGLVTDDQQHALDGVLIELLSPIDSTVLQMTITDARGKYFFEQVKSGNYRLSASGLAYGKYLSSQFHTDQSALVLAITLRPVSHVLKEVNVVSARPLMERHLDKFIINVAGAARFAGGTVMDVLEKSPGINVIDDRITMSGKSGVLILIDGRQTYLSPDALAALLKGMQSNEVEAIELISKPSAKYDAAGTGGIINIRTKKDKRFGANGNINLGGGYGATSKYNGGMALNYRNDKLNVFADYNYSDFGVQGALQLNRIVRYAGATTTYLQRTEFNDRKSNHAYKAGLDYSLNKNHTISFVYDGYLNASDSPDNPSFTAVSTVEGNTRIYGSTQVHDTNLQHFRNNSYNFNYTGKLDTLGQELTMDLVYGLYHGNENDQRKIDTIYNQLAGRYFVKNSTLSNVNIRTIKLNYVYPFSKTTRLESGFKSSWVSIDNNLEYLKSFDDEFHFLPIGTYSNRFVYGENINAAYADFSGQYGKLDVQMGLRMEYTHAKADLLGLSTRRYNYLDLFPSIALSYKVNSSNDLNISYSRRIDRPDYDSLNPTLRELDNKTFWKGNEFLTPQYSNGFELSHSYKGLLITSIDYTATTDAMIGVTEQDEATGKTYVIKRNLNLEENYSANVFAGFALWKWWQMSHNISVFHTNYAYTYDANDYHGGQTSLSMNLGNTFNLPAGFSTELALTWQSAQTHGLDRIRSFSFIDAGLRKALLNKKLLLRASMNDVFNKRIILGSTRYQGIDVTFNQKRESRIIRVSMSYAFGNSKIKTASRRENAAGQEAGRLKQ